MHSRADALSEGPLHPPGPAERKGLQALGGAAVVGAALMVIWIMAGLWLFVVPPADHARRADVLLVLGPPDDRMDYAEQLMQHGDAGTLAVSSPVDNAGQFTAPICKAATAYPVICFHPEPFTTQGEARSLQALAQQHSWHSANVLTAQFHITRARVIVARCYTGDLRMLDYSPQLSLGAWAYQYAYQSAAFLKVAVHPGC
ncbi:hypothetical protein GCM10007170_06750 [Arthrobacter liuii]|uniref:DUF218 domain-containing protein n=2 Tax=Arthrobacter liuii TaxID=1476996 RepID=A0ABQ2AGA9_9MICC|nr:hypothetical protein GCM10007170_06750 [Arthrobacter liuii]